MTVFIASFFIVSGMIAWGILITAALVSLFDWITEVK